MKTCTYCGRENRDEATQCMECGTDQFNLEAMTQAPNVEGQKEWVTLTRCRNLVDADVLASQLRAAGINVFLPDEFVMQTFSIDSNGFGFARVQVAPEELEQAKEIMSSPANIVPPPLPTSSPSETGS